MLLKIAPFPSTPSFSFRRAFRHQMILVMFFNNTWHTKALVLVNTPWQICHINEPKTFLEAG